MSSSSQRRISPALYLVGAAWRTIVLARLVGGGAGVGLGVGGEGGEGEEGREVVFLGFGALSLDGMVAVAVGVEARGALPFPLTSCGGGLLRGRGEGGGGVVSVAASA